MWFAARGQAEVVEGERRGKEADSDAVMVISGWNRRAMTQMVSLMKLIQNLCQKELAPCFPLPVRVCARVCMCH